MRVLSSDLKNLIDDLCDTLVGKFPIPQDQVDQITIGLTYKFMSDMDMESISLGGKKSFFVDNLEKCSWTEMINSKNTGKEKNNIYKYVLENIQFNSQLPDLFKEIFKNSPLPLNDIPTFNDFIKLIDKFVYSDTETLGDAYEYLLSKTGAQGKLGQFRTPRHIIDFIVRIVNPSKNDSILDPACGTAGFLVSAYKHITKKDKEGNAPLSVEDLIKLSNNIHGHDIEPKMVRISLLNLFLQGFKNPNITEYDNLTSDEKWNNFYDVILANPPFMTPKGGIRPHDKFSIKSTKSEILFLDYILEHLTPNGRAGVIVPGGVIYRTGKQTYEKVRKKIIENSLIAVFSLPKGVFNPYSPVSTHILILDKKLSKERNEIFFAKVSNDGFSLGKTRKKIDENDLPLVLNKYRDFIENESKENTIPKEQILSSPDIDLTYQRYIKTQRNEELEYVKIGEVCNVFNGSTPLKKEKKYWENGSIPWFTIDDLREQRFYISNTVQKITKKALEETTVKLLPKNSVLVCCTTSVGEIAFSEIELTTNQQFNGLVIKDEYKGQILPKYLFWTCKNLMTELTRISGNTTFDFLSGKKLKEIEIPLLDINLQNQYLEEIENNLEEIFLNEKNIEECHSRINKNISRIWGEK